jgi:RimJ/RimL family protein N-acetyltransferase
MPAIFATPRLVLRPIRLDDAPAVTAILADAAVARNLRGPPYPYTLADAESYLGRAIAEADTLLWALELAGVLIGTTALDEFAPDGHCAELGYYLARAHWGQGYASEAARAVADYAFTHLGCERLVSGHAADNPASGAVLAKLGFRIVGERSVPYPSRGGELTDWEAREP